MLIHQALHGYSDGHRLLGSSFKLPDDLARLMLRMSDLSGSAIVRGFEEYITAYPLVAMGSYILAKTWYASEMPRPGCVWTHSLVIPARTIGEIPSLLALKKLFRRPRLDATQDDYKQGISYDPVQGQLYSSKDTAFAGELDQLLWAHYVLQKPVIMSAQSAEDFEREIFALWSQQWPNLRVGFTFCTGSLSARRLAGQPFDVQCVPTTLVRDVLRESKSDSVTVPVVLPGSKWETQPWIQTAAMDATVPSGGSFRQFLWGASDDGATTADFAPLTKVFEATREARDVHSLIHIVAESFPEPTSGVQLKRLVLGSNRWPIQPVHFEEQDILLALATTSDSKSFTTESLSLRERAVALNNKKPSYAGRLVAELFWSALNPLGDEILGELIDAMSLETAGYVAEQHPQFLPSLFRANPNLAIHPSLWVAGFDRKRELFEAVAANGTLEPSLVRGIVSALLETGSQQFVLRACVIWGKDALHAVLDWAAEHSPALIDTCRDAISSNLPWVMEWVQESPERPVMPLVAIAHVVAPISTKLSSFDTTPWMRIYRNLDENGDTVEADYISAFLLALAFGNAPPSPLQLVSLSFERVHEGARLERIGESEWLVLEPLVPQLSWRKNWDKCERLRRALISSFVRHRWPASELKSRMKNHDLFLQLIKSADKVQGGAAYFQAIE